MNHHTKQFERHSDATLAAALEECYETLRIVAYCGSNASVARSWAQIDAIRDVQARRLKTSGKKAKP